jgi:uncharacterized protein YecA (UPF0149 family)
MIFRFQFDGGFQMHQSLDVFLLPGQRNTECEQAGMSERGIYDRTKAVFDYFGLPFDAAPPGPGGLPKVGRNEPCPCGSGKKYKKCCGKG